MDAIERRVIGFWFTRRHEGTKAGRQEGGLRLFSSQGFRLIPRRHCERSAAIQSFSDRALDCRVAVLLAMTEIAQEVLPARFLLTKRTVLVISRSTSSPSFRRAGQGTGHAGALPKTGHPHMVGVDWGGFADMSRAHRSNQRIPVRQGFQSGNRLNREKSRPLALSGPFDTAERSGADRMKGDRELGCCGSPDLKSQGNRRTPPLCASAPTSLSFQTRVFICPQK